MSFDEADAFYGDYYGTGTADDPYEGTIENMYPEDMDGCYFYVGTQFIEVYSREIAATEYRISAESGLSISTDGWRDVEGTLLIPGTFVIERNDLLGNWEVCATFYSVEPTPELEFLSDPVSDGQISFDYTPVMVEVSLMFSDGIGSNYTFNTEAEMRGSSIVIEDFSFSGLVAEVGGETNIGWMMLETGDVFSMDGTHDLLLPSTTVHFEPVFPSDGIEVFGTDGGLVHAA